MGVQDCLKNNQFVFDHGQVTLFRLAIPALVTLVLEENLQNLEMKRCNVSRELYIRF